MVRGMLLTWCGALRFVKVGEAKLQAHIKFQGTTWEPDGKLSTFGATHTAAIIQSRISTIIQLTKINENNAYHKISYWPRVKVSRVRLIIFGADLTDEPGDGNGVGNGENDNAAAVADHHLTTDDFGGGIVAALGEHVGFQGRENFGELF